jgi:hypothetical protein
MESLGKIFGRGEDEVFDEVAVSLQEMTPIKKMKPSKYFMVKKYRFFYEGRQREVMMQG